MTIEDKLKCVILEKYKSIRAFTKIIDIPYSTIDTMFKRGINGTSVITIIKICKALNIDTDALFDNEIKDKQITVSNETSYFSQNSLIKKYNVLDEKGKHTVNTVLEMEYTRCENEQSIIGKDEQSATKENKNLVDLSELPDYVINDILQTIQVIEFNKSQPKNENINQKTLLTG